MEATGQLTGAGILFAFEGAYNVAEVLAGCAEYIVDEGASLAKIEPA